MDILTIIIFAQAALDLVLLIVFFVMASNIAKIKKAVNNIDSSTEQQAPWDNPAYFDPVEEEISLGNNDRARELLARLEFRYRRRLDRSAMPIGGREGLFVSCGYVVTAKEDIIAQLDKDVKALKSRMK